MHIELLVEEASAEAFLNAFLPKVLPQDVTWNLIRFNGKPDLLNNLGSRLRSYSRWLPDDWKIVVLVDEDRQDCLALKHQLESAARDAGLASKTSSTSATFSVLNRIAIEELEAWFFGDAKALSATFRGVPANLGAKEAYRDPDTIAGGTWEALERVLQRHYPAGLPKIEVARLMGERMNPFENRSRSFQCFLSGLYVLVGLPPVAVITLP